MLEIRNNQITFRFIVVGIWNTVFGYLAFYFFDTILAQVNDRRYIAYMLALILAQACAVVNAFYFHRNITFRSRVKGKHLIREFMRFALTYVITFAFNIVLLPFFVEILGLNPKLAGVLLIMTSTVISYIGHSRYSFRQ